MRPVEEQTILVTGSTSGLGWATARDLLTRGATVLIHGRDPTKVKATEADLDNAAGRVGEDAAGRVGEDAAGRVGEDAARRVRGYVADLSSLDAVGDLAEQVERDVDALHVLVNNAGVGGVERQETSDGHELHLAVNHLAPFLLTSLLLPLLLRSAPARIVNVSSVGQSAIDFDDLQLDRRYHPMLAYTQSKLAQVLFTLELAERLGTDADVTVNALHPATLMDTNMVREYFGAPMSSVEEGVEAVARLAVAPELEGVTGRYFDGTEESTAHPQAYDREARRRLWEVSERLTGATGAGVER